MSTRILVITRDPVGRQMSAPGIRALNVARTLAAHVPGARVTLAIPNREGGPVEPGYTVCRFTRATLPRLILQHDIVVAQYIPAYAIPFVLTKRVVLDFFANFIAEWLELGIDRLTAAEMARMLDRGRRYLNLQLTQADLVLAANERQRDLWLGMLAAVGRITPAAYDADPTLRSLIDVASFGVRPEPAVARRNLLKGVYPGIGPSDRVLIWNGGVLGWFDPGALLQAFRRVSDLRPDVKLFFLGIKYPTKYPIEGKAVERMVAVSDSLGLTGRSVFFNEGWVDYEDSGDYLVGSDIGVCTSYDNLETHFAQRVRLIDLIWAEKPIICTRGDTVAGLVEQHKLGIAVPHGDVGAMFEAMMTLLDDEALTAKCIENARTVKKELAWELTLRPVIDFCRDLPAPSEDRTMVSTSAAAASYFWSRLAAILP